MLTYAELGRRLKNAREAMGYTQGYVAHHLSVSRVAVSQIESGQRTVSSLELKTMARLYARDVASFLRDRTDETNALSVLFRAHPDLAEDTALSTGLKQALELCRVYTELKGLIHGEEERPVAPAYMCPDPVSPWEAIQMGEQTAQDERRRLELGIDPIKNTAEVVESQGIPIDALDLENEISGIFLSDPGIGPCIFINKRDIAGFRLSFTIAHEYCHALLDREKLSTVTKKTNARDLPEVRANAFAAAFLMPEEGVRHFLRGIGKGASGSRDTVFVYSGHEETDPVIGRHRRLASSQTLTLYDVVQLHHYFGVSFEAALYRLKNLRVISDNEWEQFSARKENARKIADDLGLSLPHDIEVPIGFKVNFLHAALEAYRQDQITYAKLLQLGRLVECNTDQMNGILERLNLTNDREEGLYIPE